ncbi:MAG TPA: oxygen-independent coproporphyrinogen III oxidase [Pseudobdellovibrionaceae bacterium]|nr:oxygen-independent coproporphyrinogen III oxidase [Pseudobdellovibrionaceae bacterium]
MEIKTSAAPQKLIELQDLNPAQNLFRKYDVPAPRYTSYPTVPYWCESPTKQQWYSSVDKSLLAEDATWSLYVHLPFCETLCTFCGCNTSITKDHKVAGPYIDLILREFEQHLRLAPRLTQRRMTQIHLGGGSPTFLSADELHRLVSELYRLAGVRTGDANFEGAIEVDPRRTTSAQLEVLRRLGFTRVSLGVQDFDPETQRLVNRIQPYEMTANIVNLARSLGFESLNFDLIYGLPKQTADSIRKMVKLTLDLSPDRIALYSLARVPWIKPAQKLFRDEDLPEGAAKRELYEIARAELLASGYREIGMDHFAKPDEALSRAESEGRLHRNFMGYTDQKTNVLLGLGVSAISETQDCFAQNEKVLPIYERNVANQEWTVFRGHLLSEEDQRRRRQILALMTQFEVELESEDQLTEVRKFLSEMESDGLIEFNGRRLNLKPHGRAFLRNAAMALDQRLRAQAPTTKVFSSSL